jgi:phosphohistidine phosphatase
MKQLFLLRHAEASWDDPSEADFERELNARGRLDASRIGEFLRKREIEFDLFVSSPAVRARETVELVRAAGEIDCELRFDERIYAANIDRLFGVVEIFYDRANSVLLVGHNPGIQEFLEALTGESRSAPTAALAEIELNIKAWKDARLVAKTSLGRLTLFVIPKDLLS